MLNKKILSISLVLLLVPACIKRKVCYVPPSERIDSDVDIAIAPERVEQRAGEDIGEFVLEEDRNPFTTDALSPERQEELTVVEAEPEQTGDSHDDSARYGFKTVFYNFDDYNVRTDQKMVLAHNLNIAKDLSKKGYDIVIEGHACDSAGTPQYNLVLSENRARGELDYFAQNGIPKDRMRTVGRGSEMRLVQFGNKEQQAPNRRVEIYAYAPGKKTSIVS